jgi:hypothetical protein
VSSAIGDFTGRLLARHGALIEQDENEIRAIVPPALASALEIQEYQRLTFDPRAASGDRLAVDYDSPLVERFEPLVEDLARVAIVPPPQLTLKHIEPETSVTDAITLTNGIIRDCRVDAGRARYVGFFVQHELLADERHSGMTEVWVNVTARSAPRLSGLAEVLLSAAGHGAPQTGTDKDAPADMAATIADAWALGAALARRGVENRLEEAIDSLRRRRERDSARLHEYYKAIDDEIRRRARRALMKGDDRATNAELSRLDATARAFRGRIVELADRYRARVRLWPFAAVVCTLPIQHVAGRLRRRSSSRTITFAWNPIDRAIEPPCCEACGIGTSTVVLCDDRVHLLCPACHDACATCGRRYCRACHAQCPRRHQADIAASRHADHSADHP